MRYSYKKAFDELVGYANSEGYADVTIGGAESFVVCDKVDVDKRLNIEDGQTYENMVYLILHELGHHRIRKSWSRFTKKFPVVAYAEHVKDTKNELKYTRRNSYIVSSMEEEFMAWNEGFKLALKMGIRINEKRWMAFKSKRLKAYINHYANLNK